MALPYKFCAETIVGEGRTTLEAIAQIRSWLQSTDLPQIQDEMIVLFLLSCQNEIAPTQRTIQAYFRVKHGAPEIFSNRDIDSDALERAGRVVSLISIPVRLTNNGVVHFFKITDKNYRNFDWVDVMKLAFMLLDITQRHNPPNDLTVVIDMKGLSFMHLTRLKLGATKTFLDFLQEGMPLKIKSIHILNTNYLFDKLLAFARVFIRSELMSRLNLYPVDCDLSEFRNEFVPAACLPKDYGGKLPSVEELHRKTLEEFRELKEFFQAEEKLRGVYS